MPTPLPALLTTTLLSTTLALAALPALAQMSPVCERNGRRDYCALTPVPGSTNARQVVDLIMFADNSVYRVERSLQSCRRVSEKVETCSARITPPPAGSASIPAVFRSTYFEGGVKHEVIARGIRLSYNVAD